MTARSVPGHPSRALYMQSSRPQSVIKYLSKLQVSHTAHSFCYLSLEQPLRSVARCHRSREAGVAQNRIEMAPEHAVNQQPRHFLGVALRMICTFFIANCRVRLSQFRSTLVSRMGAEINESPCLIHSSIPEVLTIPTTTALAKEASTSSHHDNGTLSLKMAPEQAHLS